MGTSDRHELDWGDLEVLLAVCRAGSLSGAARTLGCNHSTVYRKVNAIEDRAGVRFFDRLPGGYAMTEAGELAMEAGERIEEEFHRLGREVLGSDTALRGSVRVTAPDGMVSEILPELCAEFRRRHPQVIIELFAGLSAVDLARREADVAIRATRSPPDESLGRRISRFRFAPYASPEYLERHGERPLQEQDLLILDGAVNLVVPTLFPTVEAVHARAVYYTNSSTGLLNAAEKGMGVALMSCYHGDPHPGLVRASEPIESLTMDLWVLTHPALRHTARVKAVMAFLVEQLTAMKNCFEGEID